MQTNTTPSPSAYVPGVCNINHAEIAYRRKAGYVGLVILVLLLAALIALPLSRWLRVILFFPAFLAAIGFLQARNKFCVGYAGSGMQNATEGSSKAEKVADTTAAQKDKKRARQMNLQAAGVSLAITLIALILPQMS